MATPSKKVALSVPVELDEQVYQQLKDAAGNEPLPKISAWVKYFLGEYVKGSFILSAPEVRDLEAVLGGGLRGRDIVEAVQKAQGRDDGKFVVKAPLDPAFEIPLKEQAKWQSVTPEDILADIVNSVVSNSWLYSWQPSHTIFCSAEEFESLKNATGSNRPTARQILDKLHGVIG